MFLDNTLCFGTNLSTPQAISATANSSSVIDLTGAGVGNAPAMIGGYPNVNTSMGYDIGFGDGVAIPWVTISVTAAGTGAGTITISLQSAPDNGSYSPGTYTTEYTSPAYVGTTLTLGTLLEFQVPPRALGAAIPRFYKLVYTVSGSATVSVLASISLNPPSSFTAGQYPSNYVVA